MSSFSADWLDLREPVDAMSRNPASTAELLAWRQTHDRLSVLDLGSGTGANCRYLAPLLGGQQHWVLIDHDPALMARGQELLGRWAGKQPSNLNLEWRRLDLVLDWEQLDLPDVHLVTASALLDLVSAAWLERLADHCRKWRTAVFVTLSYDGTISWEPTLERDEDLRERINRHQRTDKGFGPALGPDASATLAIVLRKLGYQVTLRPSPWRLGPTHAALQTTLLEGWLAAARQIDPGADSELDDWAIRRRRLIERGTSWLHVGHWDLFAWLKHDVPAESD